MNRLQKKCIIAATGIHLSLALVLLVGPAFLPSNKSQDSFTEITIVPDILVDTATRAGGGNAKAPPPVAAPPAPVPTPSQPAPAPEPPTVTAVKPPDRSETTEPVKANSHQVVPNLSPRVRGPKVNTTPTTQNTGSRQAADAQRKALATVASTTSSLRAGLSDGTAVNTDFGAGGGGATYANYRDFVGSVYYAAWIPPESTASDSAVVGTTVTIASDGKVISARITRPSGDAAVDASVQRTLDRVTFIAPFPAGSNDRQRTYPINFDLKTKRVA